MINTGLRYLRHFFTARHTHGFGVHSPYVYNFIQYVIYEKNPFYVYDKIEALRRKLLTDTTEIAVTDYGTGNDSIRRISDITARSVKPARYAQLFYRIIRYSKAVNVLELGTSLGITTAYLASGSQRINCVTMEGCPATARIACDNFRKLGLKNIRIVEGSIDVTLNPLIDSMESLDFIFIDANHRYKAVLGYFDACLNKIGRDTIMVIDDIYWSEEMERAWNEVKRHPSVTTTIDLFQVGIVFFNPDLNLKHYKLNF